MARLTNRPSIAYSAASRYPSATPDPAFDQENLDPEARLRDKGKQRADRPPAASRLPTPQSRDDASPSRGQKRKRITIPRPTDEEEEEEMAEDARFTKDYDPHQDPEERREVKRKQRELAQDFHDSRDELLRDEGSKLKETVDRADAIFKEVKNTSDAIPDARLLVSAGQMANKQSAALSKGDRNLGIDVDDFFSKCLSYMRNGGHIDSDTQRRPATTQDADDSDDEDARPLDWELLGRQACYPHNSRAPVPSFLLGPLSREKKQRAATQRRARQAANASQAVSRPEAITQLENDQAEQNSVTAQCQKIFTALKRRIKDASRAYRAQGFTPDDFEEGRGEHVLAEYDIKIVRTEEAEVPGVPLLKWITNPRSFSQTVENLFYVSFLIKEGNVGIIFDTDGLPVLYPEKAHTVEQQREKSITKSQAVLSLDHDTWRNMIRAYDITEPLIEHRDDTQATQMTNGWYAS